MLWTVDAEGFHGWPSGDDRPVHDLPWERIRRIDVATHRGRGGVDEDYGLACSATRPRPRRARPAGVPSAGRRGSQPRSCRSSRGCSVPRSGYGRDAESRLYGQVAPSAVRAVSAGQTRWPPRPAACAPRAGREARWRRPATEPPVRRDPATGALVATRVQPFSAPTSPRTKYFCRKR